VSDTTEGKLTFRRSPAPEAARPYPLPPAGIAGMAGSGLGLACIIGCLASTWPIPAEAAGTRYIFSSFGGDLPAEETLSIYTSTNGLDFTLLSHTGYSGPTGVLRDPSIMKHTDGKYYVAYTVQSWTTTSMSFAIASSADLLDWKLVAEIPAEVPGARDTWAPEWFKDSDGSVNLVVSIDTLGTDSDFRVYKLTAADATLTRWGTPTPIGIGPNYIDTFIVEVGGRYHAFTKNETTKFVEHATAPGLTGPWTFVGTGNWAGWGAGKQGPAVFQLDDGQWRIFLDCYGGCGLLQATSPDLATWSAASVVPDGLSGMARPGTVLREEATGSAGSSGGGAGGGAVAGRPGGGGNANGGGPGSSGPGAGSGAGTGGRGGGSGGARTSPTGTGGGVGRGGSTSLHGSSGGGPSATGGSPAGAGSMSATGSGGVGAIAIGIGADPDDAGTTDDATSDTGAPADAGSTSASTGGAPGSADAGGGPGDRTPVAASGGAGASMGAAASGAGAAGGAAAPGDPGSGWTTCGVAGSSASPGPPGTAATCLALLGLLVARTRTRGPRTRARRPPAV
jgi:hypothetical protein